MHAHVTVVGTLPTLVIDDQMVVRRKAGEEHELALDRYQHGAGYRTSLEPREIARHLLRFVKGADGFPRHQCAPELRKLLEQLSKGPR